MSNYYWCQQSVFFTWQCNLVDVQNSRQNWSSGIWDCQVFYGHCCCESQRFVSGWMDGWIGWKYKRTMFMCNLSLVLNRLAILHWSGEKQLDSSGGVLPLPVVSHFCFEVMVGLCFSLIFIKLFINTKHYLWLSLAHYYCE